MQFWSYTILNIFHHAVFELNHFEQFSPLCVHVLIKVPLLPYFSIINLLFFVIPLQLTVDVAWSPDGIDSRYYDYKRIAMATDFVFIMAYDEQSQIRGPCIAGANSAIFNALHGKNP